MGRIPGLLGQWTEGARDTITSIDNSSHQLIEFVMAQTHFSTPPLEWIRVFETAARLGSFTAAAIELNLTQAAVSQRIRKLELQLGAQLFFRQARGADLTAAGEAWLPHVQLALKSLDDTTADLFAAPRYKISIAASMSVLELWIVPRLIAKWKHGATTQFAFHTIHTTPDFERSSADLEVRFGSGDWPGLLARQLYREQLCPVAAPGARGRLSKDWTRLPLIAVAGPRLGWHDWAAMERTSLPAPPAYRFDSFVYALRAALAGAGVLLGSLPLCREALERKQIVRLSRRELEMQESYWITWNRKARHGRILEEVVELLCEG
jgi:LysR family glycine cleavage system transcriptional activator